MHTQFIFWTLHILFYSFRGLTFLDSSFMCFCHVFNYKKKENFELTNSLKKIKFIINQIKRAFYEKKKVHTPCRSNARRIKLVK
jgi:hypothetical protein